MFVGLSDLHKVRNPTLVKAEIKPLKTPFALVVKGR